VPCFRGALWRHSRARILTQKAQALDTDGWTVKIDGEVEKEMVVDAEDLIAKMPLEERVTRHRCVEAWSMVVPWVCFPLAELVKMANPTSDAKYVQFETFLDPETASGQITFTEERPVSFWEEINKAEYGFWANVNPEVDHPRWTQATERVIGTEERIPTLKFNGYGEEVAGLYSDTLAKKEGVRLWR